MAPSSLNTERVGELGIACSANLQVQSIDGKAVPVSFSLATTDGGEAPVTTSCTAESGAEFPIARTTVTCSASDNLGQAASCAFDVVVLSPPRLSVSKILAFGDSITSGVVSTPILGAIRLALEPWNSYPTKLQSRLRQGYQYQAPSVINEGEAGERAADASARLSAALARHQPDVVILMEGTNDLGAADAVEASRDQLALDAIEEMLEDIEAAGAVAILATIAPVRESGPGIHTALVGPYNTELRSIASSRGIQLVDVHALLSSGACQPMSCIGDDNIHPTAQGYSIMADAFYERLVTLYDVPITVPTAVEDSAELIETSWSE
mgnify:FL=1|jgi:lysophospholipase L1-like esterase|tara:strand:- start:17383 stop:18354 length:972 start_codon:yes stop_codon:yes gene_type:complete